MNNYQGVIIEESLADKKVLDRVKIISTKVEVATEEHKTPWVSQWTLHTVEIPEAEAKIIAEEISKSLDPDHVWYADFKNDLYHFVIFRDKVFKIDQSKKEQYQEVVNHGLSLGIPEYQLDFSPATEEWER